MSERDIDIVTMGRVAVDLYSEQVGSSLENSQSFRKYLGGCAGNIAVGCARLGLKSAIFSCVGSDAMGNFVKNTLQKEGVDTRLLRQTDQHLTGLVLLGVNPPDKFPLVFYRENCADMQLRAEDMTDDYLARTKAFLFTGTGLSTASMRQVSYESVERAKAAGCQIIFDLDYRPVLWNLTRRGNGEDRYILSDEVSRHYQSILEFCDVIVGTEEEICIAGGTDILSKALSFLRDHTKATIVVKEGAQGCKIYLPDKDKALTGEAYPVEVLNVLGAGDAFMSGLLRGILRGHDWEKAANYANACGALVVSRHGCAPAIPSEEELMYFLQYHHDKYCLSAPQLQRMHEKITFKDNRYHGQDELFILAFDHRSLFSTVCAETNIDIDKIGQFKQLVYEGFLLAKSQAGHERENNLGIIIDPIYGKNILPTLDNTGHPIGLPIEQADSMPIEYLGTESLYETLLQRPSHYFVKVLFKYHPDMEEELRYFQVTRLQQLAHCCHALERKLMLELILPSEYPQDYQKLALAMATLYEHNIYPHWWKIAPLDTVDEWLLIREVITNYESEAKIVLLGGKNAFGEDNAERFSMAKHYGHAKGFAFGRQMFWEAWQAWITHDIKDYQIPETIADKFIQTLTLWKQS